MIAPPSPKLGTIDGIPAQELLEGLSSLHQSVVVTRKDGTILWVSRALDSQLAEQRRPIGTTLAQLCGRYLESQSEHRRSHSRESTDLDDFDRRHHGVRAQIDAVLAQLDRCDFVCQHVVSSNTRGDGSTREESAVDSGHPSHRGCIEISAFSVRCGAPKKRRADTRRELASDELLHVVILRRPAKSDTPGRVGTVTHSFFGQILDQLPEATLTIDQSGFVSYANARAVSLLGKSAGELIDTPISLYFPGSAILPVGEPDEDGARSDERHRGDKDRRVVELVRGGDAAIYVEVASKPLELPDGTNAGHILQLRDTSNQRHMIERFKQKIASLESYAHTVSHDLRSPLVSMLGFTQLMKRDYGKLLDETGRRFLDRIEQAGSNMNTMTQDLLELSTREQPQSPPAPVDPRNILLQIQAELKPRLEEQCVQLVLPSLPPMIQCDRTQLYQIFSNLIGNALTHMGPCEDARIEIDIEEHDDERVIVVQDFGCGIDASEHERIFEAFHSTSRAGASRSTGVGLAIVKKIARAHGGEAWVESQPGKGAAFFVSLAHR